MKNKINLRKSLNINKKGVSNINKSMFKRAKKLKRNLSRDKTGIIIEITTGTTITKVDTGVVVVIKVGEEAEEEVIAIIIRERKKIRTSFILQTIL